MKIVNIIKKPFAKRPAKIQIFEGKNEKWYFRVVATNGKTTDSSQGYSTKSNAVRAARKLHPDLEIEADFT